MARIILFGPEGPKAFELSETIATLGRSKASTIPVDDGAASRKHCIVKREPENTFTLVDMGSANGTFVNGERVKEHALEPEDRIRIGKTVLVFKEH